MHERGGFRHQSEQPAIKEYQGDIDIFVPKEREALYLANHGIDIRDLPNGSMLAGATRVVSDNAYASVTFSFPSGSYYEPQGKGGINHLVEHLISKTPYRIAERSHASYNASTGPDALNIMLSGVANQHVLDYGLWPTIPVVLDQITCPLEITEKELTSEKGVIFGEMRKYASEHGILAGRFLNQVVLDKDNPANYPVIGSEDDLQSITLHDIKEAHQAIFIPQELETTVFAEGDRALTQTLLDMLAERLRDMQSDGRKPKKVEQQAFAKLNSNFHQGEVYMHDTGLRNGIQTINYLWVMPVRPFTVSTFAESQFFGFAAPKMFEFFRSSGLGYDANPINRNLGDNKRILGFQMHLPKQPAIDRLAKSLEPAFIQAAFGCFNDQDIAYLDDMTVKQFSAVPTSVLDRFTHALHGLKTYGRVIDSELVKEIYTMIQPEHLNESRDRILSIPPATIITGDLA